MKKFLLSLPILGLIFATGAVASEEAKTLEPIEIQAESIKLFKTLAAIPNELKEVHGHKVNYADFGKEAEQRELFKQKALKIKGSDWWEAWHAGGADLVKQFITERWFVSSNRGTAVDLADYFLRMDVEELKGAIAAQKAENWRITQAAYVGFNRRCDDMKAGVAEFCSGFKGGLKVKAPDDSVFDSLKSKTKVEKGVDLWKAMEALAKLEDGIGAVEAVLEPTKNLIRESAKVQKEGELDFAALMEKNHEEEMEKVAAKIREQQEKEEAKAQIVAKENDWFALDDEEEKEGLKGKEEDGAAPVDNDEGNDNSKSKEEDVAVPVDDGEGNDNS
ncbi:MAG: hypothetical protein ACPGXY_02110 [Alphaproteobacteria bacterium]